jgi:hypothetical protein
MLAILDPDKLRSILRRVLDPREFLSDYGIRSLSKCHADQPFCLELGGNEYPLTYEPAESRTDLYGGNSNWRGPVWFPLNYLLIHSLRQYHRYYGDSFRVELPTGSGRMATLAQVADEISHRLIKIFLPDEARGGRRPVFGDHDLFQKDPTWSDQLLFYEYFHGDHGSGLGASHQTGWTALVAELIQEQGRQRGP